MVKRDVPGVEELAAQSMVGAVVSPAVELVSHDRMARVVERNLIGRARAALDAVDEEADGRDRQLLQ